jgi:hypothetical protein
MNTEATVVIKAVDQAAAQQDLGEGMFTSGYYEAVEGADFETATHYVSSGFWMNTELDFIVNSSTWGKLVKFGNAQAVLAELNLIAVGTNPSKPEVLVEEPTVEQQVA